MSANERVPATVLERLKAETRADHDAIDAALDLARDGLTAEEYRRTLERFYGFYRPLESEPGAGTTFYFTLAAPEGTP